LTAQTMHGMYTLVNEKTDDDDNTNNGE